jgi:hypothetical protein
MHLEGVLREEGIAEEENVTLANTPFTTMCVTRDYNCNIHTDSDDVSYGFFIWFGAHGMYLFFVFLIVFYHFMYHI